MYGCESVLHSQKVSFTFHVHDKTSISVLFDVYDISVIFDMYDISVTFDMYDISVLFDMYDISVLFDMYDISFIFDMYDKQVTVTFDLHDEYCHACDMHDKHAVSLNPPRCEGACMC